MMPRFVALWHERDACAHIRAHIFARVLDSCCVATVS